VRDGRSSTSVLGSRRIVLLTAGLGLISILSLGLLIALPYSTSLIQSVPPEAAQKPPERAFAIGPLEWDVAGYSRAESLEPFRQLLLTSCTGGTGLTVAVCISDAMARSFPNGQPRTEFVNPTFDPVSHMRAHMSGEPRHCLNRSAILAAPLLASGRPARVVQILSPDLQGHTVVEVWDEVEGWTVVDPTFGLVLESSRGHASASALVSKRVEGGMRWQSAGAAPAGDEHPLPVSIWKGGTALYPEPWLYLRTGRRQAFWPFRGRYVSLRPAHVLLGLAQKALGALCATAFLGAALGLTSLLFRALRPGYSTLSPEPKRPT